MDLHVLEIKFNLNQRTDALYPVLLQDRHELILVDCGYEGFMPLIEEAALRQGISLEKLTGLILTHHDIDHMGAAFALKSKYPLVNIYSSAIEAAYISGKSKSLRLLQAETMYDALPEDQKPGALYFQEMLRKVRPVEVDYPFLPDQVPAFMKAIQFIATPGHMPGHLSLYHEASKTLIAADALVYEGDELEIANPAFTLDLPEAVASIKKLQQFDIATIVCYHGGVVDQDIPDKLSKLIARYT